MEVSPLGEIDQVEIEALMLAEWAEVINGKLYVQGGGWDRRLVSGEAFFAIVASVAIPWSLTNQQHEFSITLADDHGAPVAPVHTDNFTMGRPPNALPGQWFRWPFVLRGNFELPGTGAYTVEMVVNGSVRRSVSFYVVDAL